MVGERSEALEGFNNSLLEVTKPKVLFVGDIQGDIDLVEMLPRRLPDHHFIFVGDILASFYYSPAKQIRALSLVLDYVEQGFATLTWSNHDLQYVNPRMRCSGYKEETQAMFDGPLRNRLTKLWVPYVYEPDLQLLVTHAGLNHATWLQSIGGEDEITWPLEEALWQWTRDRDSPFYKIGRYRGGPDKEGGPLWNDWTAEFKPVAGLTQVFGHSCSDKEKARKCTEERIGLLRRTEAGGTYSWCIDNLQRGYEFLEFEPSRVVTCSQHADISAALSCKGCGLKPLKLD